MSIASVFALDRYDTQYGKKVEKTFFPFLFVHSYVRTWIVCWFRGVYIWYYQGFISILSDSLLLYPLELL